MDNDMAPRLHICFRSADDRSGSSKRRPASATIGSDCLMIGGELKGDLDLYATVDSELDFSASGRAVLDHVECERIDGMWCARDGGGSEERPVKAMLDEAGSGLHDLGGSSRDAVRLKRVLASREVASIKLSSDCSVT